MPGIAATESTTVLGVGAGSLTVTAVSNGHASGTTVATGVPDFGKNAFMGFGGTSHSCPTVAGAAALVLSVRPDLNWLELQDILRRSATPIDTAQAFPSGRWRDLDGDGTREFSPWYGYGRLNVQAAVTRAIALAQRTDVVVRDNLMDTGLVPSPGWHAESPDIWVRATDDPIPALAYLGPPPHENPRADNMKVVVTSYDGDQPIYNTRFLAFATHYGFQPWACRPRRPETKGKVERPFWYVENNLLNGRTFSSLEHLNEMTTHWLAETADVRTHRETKRRPIDLFEEEKPHLLVLPARPYDTARVLYRTVDPDGHIAYLQNFYSVPWQRIGEMLPVRVTENELTVYGPDVKEIARHELYPAGISGDKRTVGAHSPGRDQLQKRELLQQRFAEFGPAGVRFFEELLRANTGTGPHRARR